MAAIVAALRKGLDPDDLKGMVEAAAAALEAAAEPGSAQPSAAGRGPKAASDAQEAARLQLQLAQEVCYSICETERPAHSMQRAAKPRFHEFCKLMVHLPCGYAGHSASRWYLRVVTSLGSQGTTAHAGQRPRGGSCQR